MRPLTVVVFALGLGLLVGCRKDVLPARVIAHPTQEKPSAGEPLHTAPDFIQDSPAFDPKTATEKGVEREKCRMIQTGDLTSIPELWRAHSSGDCR